jgi:RNA polymerase sigma factor (sigma-70 family)
MSMRISGAALGEIQRVFGWGAMGTWTDSQLIERFLAGDEEGETAFRVLLHRHGPMVLGVCRRVLGDEHAAEDAFQATFLVLVRKAGMLRDRGLLANWLYGVALRVAHKDRARGERRRVVERHAAERAPREAQVPGTVELRSLIDEEIRRLPERYRLPLLLCHVEGLRHDEVARRLGCPVGTVESRLSRARERLRTRLARRGLAPSASTMAALLRPPGIGPVPSSLIATTLRAALERPVLEATLPAAARALLGRAGRTAAGVSSAVGAAAAGMVICAGIAAVGLGWSRAEMPRPRPTPPTPATATARDAGMPPTPRRTPQAVDRPKSAIAEADAASGKTDEEARSKAVARLVEQLRRHPARRSVTAGQVGLYLIGAEGGEATLIANEPAPGLNQCGSPAWSHDGRRIIFDATPGAAVGGANFRLSHLRSLELDGDRPPAQDLGEGNCPDFSPADDRIVFLLNSVAEPGAQIGVWLMQSDGSGRRSLGTYGRPKWSPDSRQFLIVSFSNPTQVTIMDVRPERSGVLDLPGHQIFSVPSWADEGTIVAVIGAGAGDTIALIDVTDPARGKVKEVLWKQGRGLDVKPYGPIYSPVARRCVFIGKTEGTGRALYSFRHGQPDPPRRLEAEGLFDNLIQDPIFSPDGRYIVFSSDRKPDHNPRTAAPAP